MIAQRREHHVNENLRRSNARQCCYDYCQVQQVLKKVYNRTKLGVRTSSPFIVQHVHVNGTITIILRPGVSKRINICRILSFVDTTSTNPL